MTASRFPSRKCTQNASRTYVYGVRIFRLLDLNIHLEDVLTILGEKKNQYQTCFSFIYNEINS